jgi:anti-sigma regulatory factor (Ser/Thr protein kinase)
VKKALKQLGVDVRTIKNIVIALYEAEVNVVAHAYEGTISVVIDHDKITTEIIDKGPGIPDIALAMQVGYSTASKKVREMGFGAGMGLQNMKKNTDDLKITSTIDKGTTVVMVNHF